MPVKRKVDLIRYCPGSADGSPAYLPEQEARDRVAIDSAYLDRMATRGVIRQPYSIPHTGECSNECRWAY
jgi:hypothetical protein